jgi:hypothetical protein
MKKIILLNAFCLLFSVYYSNAQKDEYWNFSKSALKFNTGIGILDTINNNCTTVTLSNCHASICDKRGNLLFYSNGYNIYDRNNNILPNGNHFNHSTYGNIYINGNSGYPVNKGAIIIPSVKDTNKFYMFYNDLEYEEQPSNNLLPSKLRVLEINKSLNGGLGDVTFKDSTLIVGDTLINGNIFATKNGNGKDWWVIIKKYHSDKYFIIPIDSNGVGTPVIQHIGTAYTTPYTYPASGDISINGDKLVYLYISLNYLNGQLDVLDFDRCTGTLSNPKTEVIPFVSNSDTLYWWTSCISPNGKYLYATSGNHLWQMDLTSNSIINSRINVGNWDGTKVFGNETFFYQMKNGIDDKTYVSCYGGNSYLHVINKPDSFGMTCNFVQKQLYVGYWGHNHFQRGSLPNTPNFLLGKATCGVGIEEVKSDGLQVYPSPASNQLIFKNTTFHSISIYNLLGELEKEQLVNLNATNEIDISKLPTGLYFLKGVDSAGLQQVVKFIKE